MGSCVSFIWVGVLGFCVFSGAAVVVWQANSCGLTPACHRVVADHGTAPIKSEKAVDQKQAQSEALPNIRLFFRIFARWLR